MRRYLFPLILGLGGIAILISLGLWQVRRLGWKEALLAEITAKIAASPVAFDSIAAPGPKADMYRPVTIDGQTTGEVLFVLSGRKSEGPGYEVIEAFATKGGRRILLDRGFVPEGGQTTPRAPVALSGAGNLFWPNEADSYTPPPDAKSGLWFARDVDGMSKKLGTEPVMVVLSAADGDAQGISPTPVDTAGIPNDHREYAITWFSLAAVWAGMTVFLLWRIRQRKI